MKHLCLYLLLLAPALSMAQTYSVFEKISIRSGGPAGVLNENANATSYDVSAANSLLYVGSEEVFTPRVDLRPATARVNYRIRESSGPTTGTFTSLTLSDRTTTDDVRLYRGVNGEGCNCPINLDLFSAAPTNGTFTLDTYISIQQYDGEVLTGKPQYIVFTVTGKGALPVTLTSFLVQKQGTGVLLTWITVAERDNSRFEVERSRDLQNWQRVALAEGGGTTTAPRTYEARDESPPRGISYYRLKQIDHNGLATTFRPQSVTIEANPAIMLLPTVIDRDLQVRGVEAALSLRIYDLTGTLQQQHALTTATTTLDLSGLRSGVYVVRTQDETTTRSQRIIVQH